MTATICRDIKRSGLSIKKKWRVALQRCELERAEFISEVLDFDPSMLVFVDETGSEIQSESTATAFVE